MADEQAFPGAFCVGPNDDLYPPTPGMTLRDWFAGQALTAAWGAAMQFSPSGVNPEDFAAEQAYRIADAMLATRSGPAS